MTEQSWKPLFRSPRSTITKVLRSPAFVSSREWTATTVDDPAALRALADTVERLKCDDAPLSAVAGHVAAAVSFVRARADRLEADPEADPAPASEDTSHAPADAARERLLVASLHYLITPVDMVPDFQVGGYIDDVVLLSWIFGAAAVQLEPFLADDPDVV